MSEQHFLFLFCPPSLTSRIADSRGSNRIETGNVIHSTRLLALKLGCETISRTHLHLDDLVLQLGLVLQPLHHVVKVHGAHEAAELEQPLVGLGDRIQFFLKVMVWNSRCYESIF